MPQAMGGTEIYTHTLATFQKNSGHDAAVLTPHIEYYRPGQMKEHYRYDGVDVYQYLEETDPTNREIHYGNKEPEGLSNFIILINQLQPDVIHFHELNRSIGLTLAHLKLAKQTGAKVFVTMHLPFYSCNTNVLIYNDELCDGIIRHYRCSECSYKTLFNIPSVFAKPLAGIGLGAENASVTTKLPAGKVKSLLSVPSVISRIKNDLCELWQHADQLISLNNWYKKILVDNGVPANKITVAPLALVSTKKNTISKTKRPPGLPVIIVFVGRIQPIKGIHLIIEAMQSFSPEQVCFDIYGMHDNSVYYKECRKKSSNLDTISWKGELKREEVIERMSCYDIFCLPSTTSEMSPLVIQEAFAAGIPVLASRVYGNMEQVQHDRNGLLFEFNSSKSLKNEIQSLIDDPHLLQKMKDNIIPPKDFNEVNEAYLQLYASVDKNKIFITNNTRIENE